MRVETLVQNDVKLLGELQPEGWGDIMLNFDFYTKYSFCFPIKTVIENKIAGIGATIVHDDVAWLGHIIVHPDYRNRGIGKLITENLVEIGKANKCATIYLVATDLGAPVYEKVGFEMEAGYFFFKDIKLKNETVISKNVQPFHEMFREQIAVTDKIASGENRMMHVEDHLQNGFIYSNNDKIGGYYLPTFGEGLIIANNPIAGIELLKFHLQKNEKVTFPKENTAAIDFLYKNGFKEFRIAKRMRLGKKRPLHLENIYNRVGGNVG
jgi:ribosomal protein S18 acetylase RimI-like enzyme